MTVWLLTANLGDIAYPVAAADLVAEGGLWGRVIASAGPFRVVESADERFLVGQDDLPGRVVVCADCSSSLDVAYRLWQEGVLEPWDAVWAVGQWAGRGQRGRRWESVAGNLHVAWLWPADTGAGDLVPLVAGLTAVRALSGFGASLQIKWPNDLLLGGGKVGGILVERRGDFLAAGIGLNHASAPQLEVRDPDAPEPVSLIAQGIDPDPIDLWDAFLREGARCLALASDPARRTEFVREVESCLAWRGDSITIVLPDRRESPYKAVLAGLSPDGGLRVICGKRTQIVYNAGIIPNPMD